MADSAKSHRLVEIDALRGLAALAVVLFHYTTRFDELFGRDSPPALSFPEGYYGVNLFFIISGFVIFMTLDRTARPMDFIVSRFSRLFPAYWVAIFLTFSITHLLGLPDKLVSANTALGNLIMIHGLFHIPHVDGVYWTLEVEVLFYCGMFILYRMRRLYQIHLVLLALLSMRLIYFVMTKRYGMELSWTIYHLLILKHIPWFALGISIYLATDRHAAQHWHTGLLTALSAILTLLIVDSVFLAVLASLLAAAVFLAASGRASLLQNRLLGWLGSITYPLYLLHENIGWSIQLRLRELGVPTNSSIVLTIAIALLMAATMTRYIEQPALHWIRNNYRNRQALATR